MAHLPSFKRLTLDFADSPYGGIEVRGQLEMTGVEKAGCLQFLRLIPSSAIDYTDIHERWPSLLGDFTVFVAGELIDEGCNLIRNEIKEREKFRSVAAIEQHIEESLAKMTKGD